MANSYVFYANKNGRPTGLPGFRGPKGEQGEQGLQGVQGLQGDPGVFIGSEEDMPAGTRVRLDPNGSADIAAVINDTNISEDETWSSDKINSVIGGLLTTINNLTAVVDRSSDMRYIGSGTPDKWSLHKVGSIASLSIVTRESTWNVGNEIWLGFLPEDCMPLEGDIKIFAPSNLTGASGTSGSNEFIVTIKGDSTIAVQPIIKLTDAKCIINITYICAPAQSAN